MIELLLTAIDNISPPTPKLILNMFESTSNIQVNFWYHIVIFIIIGIIAFFLSGYQRRYGRLLTLSYTTLWLLFQPFQEGLLTLNLQNHPYINPGIIEYITNGNGLLHTFQLMLGIASLLVTLRFILYVFIIGPIQYKSHQREGIAYRKRANREHQKLQRMKYKQERKNINENVNEPDKPVEKERKRKTPSHADRDINNYL